jgi:uncharacterized surface protein with fasciclin (FAS1) repeats
MNLIPTTRTVSYRLVTAFALALVFVVTTGCDDEDLGTSNATEPTLAEIARSVPVLSTLNTALQEAGLDEQLENNESGLTVFMPQNTAFDAVEVNELTLPQNEDILTDVLSYHVVPEVVKIEEGSNPIQPGTQETYPTLEGGTVTIRVAEGGGVTVNGVSISNPDVDAANGVAHVADGVLLESLDAVDRAAVAPQFSILRRLIGEAGLEETLRGPGPNADDGLTVFAPSDEAFLAALDANGNGRVDDSEVPNNLGDILAHHVVDGEIFASDIPSGGTSAPTLEGTEVTATATGDGVTIDSGDEVATVAAPDVRIENGVVHGIDTVLFP